MFVFVVAGGLGDPAERGGRQTVLCERGDWRLAVGAAVSLVARMNIATFSSLRKEADTVQQRDAALCSVLGVGLLGGGALRRGLLEGLPVVPLVVRPSAQRLAPLPQPR